MKEEYIIEFIDACFDEDIEKINEMLIQRPKLINAKNSLGETVLHILVINNKVDAVAYLYDKGADLNTKSICNCATPLSDASMLGYKNLVKFLLSHKADTSGVFSMGGNILHEAIRSSDLEIIKMIVGYGVDIFQKNSLKESLLHLSVENEKLIETTKYLVAQGLSLNEQTGFGETPLHIASAEGNVNTAKYLLDEGASLDLKDIQGRTPFMLAKEYNHSKLLELMKNYTPYNKSQI